MYRTVTMMIATFLVIQAGTTLTLADVFYGVPEHGSNLYEVDPVNGDWTSIGDTGLTDINALDFSPEKDLWTIATLGADRVIAKLDTQNGGFTWQTPLVNDLGELFDPGWLESIAFNPLTGIAYTISAAGPNYGWLYSVDVGTGELTAITHLNSYLNMPADPGNIQAVDFMSNGLMYMVLNSADKLAWYDIANDELNVSPEAEPLFVTLNGMTVDSHDTLWGVDVAGPSLMEIDPGTGRAVLPLIGMDFGGEMAAIPEPTTLSVLLFSGVVALKRRR